ncbi:pimeloyl-ACP methyl ester carboxylesterase [Paenochrobactrum gallinarii]|uniref:Pimeloyl-ACP methyl ester carboxylesterase n=1 Tax=Paenochrobactrum gallinarii TaxID=643673 RepID=A0A841M452_9HYPH|nr:alpha/beta hydrolase [Paenochrobactrum gallinarii]MBB6262549.1 pimeloyl-ACP methyl ester carboxylesterase [Paenochrobactrum gallinarii]
MNTKTSLSTYHEGRAPAGDVEIFYRQFGVPGKIPVIIVHGLSFFSYDWMGVAAALSTDREVVAIDMRGFGQSGRSVAHDYSLRRNAADIIALMDHLGWDKAVLVGHSMGGRICLLAAGWYPERVAGLCCLDFAPDLAAEGRKYVANSIGRQPDHFATIDEALAYHGHDPAALGPDDPMRKRFREFMRPVEGGWELLRDLYFRDKFRKVLETGVRQPEEADPWVTLNKLNYPFLVVRGAGSNLFASDTMAKVSGANPHARVVEIAGSHDLAQDNPQDVVTEVKSYLNAMGV